jgi:predicted dehydrogenase
MHRLQWGILSTGSIARAFAEGVNRSETGKLTAVASRDLAKAEQFCQEFGGKPYGSYEEMLADTSVDAVYIATPHHLHLENILSCAQAGKGILCEKPITLTAAEAEIAVAAARKANVFLMEAFMYRCHPQTLKVREIVAETELGEVRSMNLEFGYNTTRGGEGFRLAAHLGGGGLMDVGCYCVSYGRMIAGNPPTRVEYAAKVEDRGYDEWGSGVLRYGTGPIAAFGCAVHVELQNQAIISGDKGRLVVQTPWKPAGIITLQRPGQPDAVWNFPEEGKLYAYEADAVAASFDKKESPLVPVKETLENMRTLDALRASAGMTFTTP